ncbi:MAG: iron-sulfur cluster assembly scaffold protein [Alphaproteobacteria bacterium]
MAEQLYQAAIVETARRATGKGRLPAPDASATLDNPLCGDRVTIDLALDGGRVTALGHDVRGCVLCEAAASVIGAHAIGATADELRAAARSAASLLKDSATQPAWPDLAMFAPARPHRSRHRCVLLPFEALEAALAKAAPKR